MLVQTIRDGEALQVGEVLVKVLHTRNGRAKLGIEAPREQKVWRLGRESLPQGTSSDTLTPEQV